MIEIQLAKECGISLMQVQAVISLMEDGATVPFIARYRKEQTGSMDDNQLRLFDERLKYWRELQSRKETVLKSIVEQGKLTEELKTAIEQATSKTDLEDLYLPFKPKRRTKGQIAKEAGLEPLAVNLWRKPQLYPESEAKSYLNPQKGFADVPAVLEGAQFILMEGFAENPGLIKRLRSQLRQRAFLTSKVVKGKEEEGQKFSDYFDYSERYSKVAAHRALALFRGQTSGILRVRLTPEDQINGEKSTHYEDLVARQFGIYNHGRPADDWLQKVVKATWKIKLLPHLETDLFSTLREAAETSSIQVFSKNLKDLLLAAPAGKKVCLGLDPGIRTGVKLAIVDETGKLLETATLYPHAPRHDWEGSKAKLTQLCQKFTVTLMSIGNGTASRETERLVSEVLRENPDLNAQKVVVNEAGASVYSASQLAAEEFPNLDVSLRGAVSIARRLQDPLAELVKIEPKSIGVGQYQHDVNQTQLAQSLDACVEDCVNAVGVEINTASPALLARVSGLNQTTAQNIVQFRNKNGEFRDRKSFIKVPRLGAKAFEQAAGFLRIQDAENPLDASGVHPESYPVVASIVQQTGTSLKEIIGNESFLNHINPADYVTDQFGLPTVQDILKELAKPGRDPRPTFQTANLREGVETISDLTAGMQLEGTVTNVTHFGAFVDIGVHQDGLVHISKLANRFVSDPHEVVHAGQIVQVCVMEVDVKRKRISLSMVEN